MTDIEIINAKIAKLYRLVDNTPIFRLVWANDIYEPRFGTYRDFTESGLFLREVTEMRITRKYSYIHERWILERWAPGNLTANPETPGAENGDYLPVYVFEDAKGNYLPPTEKVVSFIIKFSFGEIRKDEVPSEEYLEEKEIQSQVESMDTHPIFQTSPGPGRDSIGYNKGLKDVT